MSVSVAEMIEGGVWFEVYPGKPPVYVTHEAHIKRLVSDGARIVADPRLPALPAPQEHTVDVQAELAKLQAEREELEALRKQLEEERKANIQAARENFGKPANKAR